MLGAKWFVALTALSSFVAMIGRLTALGTSSTEWPRVIKWNRRDYAMMVFFNALWLGWAIAILWTIW
jgi:hypothetical protein